MQDWLSENEGKKIYMHNGKMAASKDIGLHKAGTKIVNFMNGLHNSDNKQNSYKSYYTQKFISNFEFSKDTVYFALHSHRSKRWPE